MAEIHELLKKYWGHSSFRPGQEEAIRSVLAGRHTLLLLPTGGGKSVCFQIPALAIGKLCIVVTPLIALMKDQVDQLKKRGIKATAIHSGMTNREIDIALDNCVYGQTAFLYVSPERLSSDLMIARTKKMKVGLLAIDEAHCISQWGYDFRSSYLKIPDFRAHLPDVPVIALTATATQEVRHDILDKLEILGANVLQQTFARKNLSYSVFKTESKEEKLLALLRNVPGTAIVYVRTRNRTVQIANWLSKSGISASAYHAGLTASQRNERQTDWIHNRVRVMVATNAFGMGIDKPNVRAVVHWDLPESLEAYYQEAGRAGRDGLKAYALALYHDVDLVSLRQNVDRKYPDLAFVKRLYQALANYLEIPVGSGMHTSYDFDLDKFTTAFDLPRTESFYALQFLEREGFLMLNEAFNTPSRVKFLIDKIALYDFQLRNFNYDPFIKRLLRFYGGEIFTTYTPISEDALAKSLSCPVDDIYKGLEFLHARTVLEYERRRDKPQIQLLTGRYDASKLPIQMHAVKKRREKDTVKMEAVVDYASHPAQCRSILLLQYFDETDATYCNICDHCIQRKKKKSTTDTTTFAEQIREFLIHKGKAMPNEIRNIFHQMDIGTFSEALHGLVESETLIYDSAGNLLLNPRDL
jgi:ATP-dependent DNA helicase RecQ